MKLSGRFQNLAITALALFGFISMSRALWLAPMTMLWSSTARAKPIVLGTLASYQQYGTTSCSTFCLDYVPSCLSGNTHLSSHV